MFKVLNEYDQTIPNIVEEAISRKEQQWKSAMNEVISNSQIEIKSLQDQLLMKNRQMEESDVGSERRWRVDEHSECSGRDEASESGIGAKE